MPGCLQNQYRGRREGLDRVPGEGSARMADQPELDAFFDRTASLAARPRTVRELPGGLTNRNYQVSTPTGTFVARVSDGGSELLAIDRDCEYRNSVTAAAAAVTRSEEHTSELQSLRHLV